MSRLKPREPTELIRVIRDFLLGRHANRQNRYMMDQSPRDPPLANLPPGVSHKLSANYYLSRDPRRAVEPPKLVEKSQAQLPSPGGRPPQ